jgi:hypothetical protein
LVLISGPLAFCADISENGGNESASSPLVVLIGPSSEQSAAGDIFNISYRVLNMANYVVMNLTLTTEENGTVDLDVPALLPGQSTVGNESIKIKDMNSPIVRRASAQANDPVGRIVVGENTTSIDIKIRGA